MATRHVGGTAIVLLYHRVATLERDPQLLAVSSRAFDNHMAMLAERFHPMSLDALLASLKKRSVPRRAVAVTFDDGYEDNAQTAEPILAKHGIPATVFVSSGYADATREFWWDEVEWLVLGSEYPLPDDLTIEVPNARFVHRRSEPERSAYTAGSDGAAWDVTMEPQTARHRLYLDLCAFIRPLRPSHREQAMSALREALSAPLVVRDTHRPLTAEEIRQLDSSAFVDIGGHTTHHPVLSALALDEQRTEIIDDRTALEEICGRPIRTFSYPFGSLDDYTEHTVDIVREAGYRGACSNHPDAVKPWTDRYRLPRQLVRNWDAEDLAARMEGWFRGSR